MAISKEKKDELEARMFRLGLHEADIVEKFILGSGSGGQKINKTSSCVYLKHLVTGIEIKCQAERSRDLNRYRARQKLCEALETMMFQEKSKAQQQAEKIRRQKQRRTRRQKQKMLEDKSRHSDKKALRQSPQE